MVMTDNERKKEKEFATLKRFVEVYCNNHHGTTDDQVCDECAELLEYGRHRLENCPYDPKPKCKDCPTHCYRPKYREKVKEIMRFSGMYFVKRGRVDWLVIYFAQ